MGSRGLPGAPTRLVGREAEVAGVVQLLADPDIRVVTVVGPAGVGKTRLCVEVSRRQAARQVRVEFVHLADVDDPARFPAVLLAALGGTDVGSRPAIDSVVDLLAEHETLLVLDNFEHLMAAATEVARLVEATSRITLLVSSRRPLGVRAEHCLRLAPLAVPPNPHLAVEEALTFGSVALCVDRLQAAEAPYQLSRDNVPDLVRICQRLEGLPLGLELAMARVRGLPLATVADALEARIDLLGPAAPDLPARQRTITAAVRWSVDLLTPGAAALFRRLSVHSGMSIDAVAGIAPEIGLDQLQVFDALGELVAHSLVVREPGDRFRMLEPIRDVALRQLDEAGETEQARDRHAAWFLTFGEELASELTGDRQGQTLDRLQADAANLGAAVQHFVNTGDGEAALRLCVALRMLWYVRGSLTEGRDLFAAALALDGAPVPLRVAAMTEAAALARHHGDLPAAGALTRDAVQEARRTGDEPLLAAALLQLGFVLHLSGNWAEARQALEESLTVSHRLDDRLGVARASHHLGFVAYFGDGDTALAWELQCRCLALFRDMGNQRHVLTTLITMTELARAREDLRAARELAAEAADHLRVLRDTPLLVHALHHVASLAADEGSPTLALRLLGAAEGLAAASGAAAWPAVASGAARWLPTAERTLGPRRAETVRAQGRHLDSDDALALLETPASSRPEPSNLSRREQEVADLVAEGLTNRAIAERLVVSERTVDGHVSRALAKLGLSNRTQLASYVAGRL